MMASSRAHASAWILASLLASTSAFADPSAADRETARTLMQQGREQRAKGDLKEALKRFRAADDIMHVPSTGLEVARSQVALGQLVEARDTVAAIRRIAPKPDDPAPFKEARAKAEELDSSLNGRVPALNIAIKGAGPGETPIVSIDGEPLPPGVLGLPRAVDPGHHVIEVKTTNGAAKEEVDVHEGDQTPVELTLVANVAVPELDESNKREPDAPLPESKSHSPTLLTWTGVGVAGAGIIVGTVTGVLSMSKKSTLTSECTNDICGPSSYSDYNAANSLATVSTIGFIAAGVGAVVAAATLLVGHRESAGAPAAPPAAETGLTIRPSIGLGSAGVTGTF
jgi:hypothetical protein